MKEFPPFFGPYAMMLKGLILMLDGLPEREKIAAALDSAMAQVAGQPPMPPTGQPVSGAPPGEEPNPAPGMPFIPAAISNLLKQPGAISAARTLGQ